MTIDPAELVANQATVEPAKAENLKALGKMAANADHQADHIRGIVAATMAQLTS